MKSKVSSGRAKRVVLTACAVFFLAVFSVAGAMCAFKYLNEVHTETAYTKLKEQVMQSEQGYPDAVDSGAQIPFEIDVAALREQNPDTAGWLYIPCLDVSYPLMYSGDNDYYLHRNFEQEYAYADSLFLDMYSKPDFSSPNTVIYGHNMLNGTMFGHLWYIPLQHAADDNPYFWIYTPDGIYQYRIFSAFESDLYSPAFKQFEKGSQEFLDWCYERKTAARTYPVFAATGCCHP